MEHIIKKPHLAILRTFLVLRLKPAGQQYGPRSQAEIDRLTKGWERKSESIRAKMVRIGI
jgi:hypothetical protein